MFSKFSLVKLGKYILKENERIGEFDGNNLPVYGVTNIDGATLTGKDASTDLSNYKLLKPNRFVYNPYRINVGSIGLSKKEQSGIVSPAYVVFKTKENLYSKYLYYFLKSPSGSLQIRFYGNRGSVRQALRYADLCKIEIPLPSLKEQIRIVNKIKRLEASINLANKIVQQLIEGNKDLLDSLIFRILEEITEKYGDKLVSLSNVCNLITDGTHDTPSYVDEGIPLLTAKNIYHDRIDTENVRYISKEDHQIIYKRAPAEMDDVLFINIGATTGTVKKIDIDLDFSLKNVALLKPNPKLLDPDFLVLILRGPAVKKQILEKQSQTCQPFLSLRDLRSLEAPIPPLNEQRKYISYIKSVATQIENVGYTLKETEEDLVELSHSILDKAFKGEL